MCLSHIVFFFFAWSLQAFILFVSLFDDHSDPPTNPCLSCTHTYWTAHTQAGSFLCYFLLPVSKLVWLWLVWPEQVIVKGSVDEVLDLTAEIMLILVPGPKWLMGKLLAGRPLCRKYCGEPMVTFFVWWYWWFQDGLCWGWNSFLSVIKNTEGKMCACTYTHTHTLAHYL